MLHRTSPKLIDASTGTAAVPCLVRLLTPIAVVNFEEPKEPVEVHLGTSNTEMIVALLAIATIRTSVYMSADPNR